MKWRRCIGLPGDRDCPQAPAPRSFWCDTHNKRRISNITAQLEQIARDWPQEATDA